MGSGDGFYVVSDDGFYVGSDDGFMLVLRMFHMTIFMLNPNTISSLKRSLSSESERNCDIFSQWSPLFISVQFIRDFLLLWAAPFLTYCPDWTAHVYKCLIKSAIFCYRYMSGIYSDNCVVIRYIIPLKATGTRGYNVNLVCLRGVITVSGLTEQCSVNDIAELESPVSITFIRFSLRNWLHSQKYLNL